MSQQTAKPLGPSLDVSKLPPIGRRSSARTADHVAKIKESTKGIHLYISIPENHGFFLKCLPPDLTVGKVISKFVMLLPKGADISRYHVFQNGLRVMDEERTLNKLVTEMGCLEIKRDLEFELMNVENNAVKIYITEALTSGEGESFYSVILISSRERNVPNTFPWQNKELGSFRF